MGKNLKNNIHTYVCLCVCIQVYGRYMFINAHVCVYVLGIWKIHVYKCTYVCVCVCVCVCIRYMEDTCL